MKTLHNILATGHEVSDPIELYGVGERFYWLNGSTIQQFLVIQDSSGDKLLVNMTTHELVYSTYSLLETANKAKILDVSRFNLIAPGVKFTLPSKDSTVRGTYMKLACNERAVCVNTGKVYRVKDSMKVLV